MRHQTISVLLLAGGLLPWTAPDRCALAADSGPANESSVSAPSKRKPLVVMKQTEIKGRVFLIGEEDEEAKPAGAIPVELRVTTKDKPFHRTTTDPQGNYTLPNLEVGLYTMTVGLLILELRVEAPDSGVQGSTRIPKMIFVFLPKELATTVQKNQN